MPLYHRIEYSDCLTTTHVFFYHYKLLYFLNNYYDHKGELLIFKLFYMQLLYNLVISQLTLGVPRNTIIPKMEISSFFLSIHPSSKSCLNVLKQTDDYNLEAK